MTLWNVPVPTPVAIAIGNTVSNGVPVAGAGNLETPGSSDVYTFSATANQVVNFDGLNPCGFGFPDLRWSVTGPSGQVVFTEPGVVGMLRGPRQQDDAGDRDLHDHGHRRERRVRGVSFRIQ